MCQRESSLEWRGNNATVSSEKLVTQRLLILLINKRLHYIRICLKGEITAFLLVIQNFQPIKDALLMHRHRTSGG